MSRETTSTFVGKLGFYLTLVATGLFVAWPISIMFEESFGVDISPIFSGQSITLIGGVPFYSGGIHPTLVNYIDALNIQAFPRLVLNSTMIGTASVGIALFAGVPAGYALARMRFKGRRSVAFSLLALRTVSPFALVLPLYLAYVQIGLWDTYLGMALAYLAIDLPIIVWMMRGFFTDVPSEVYEAAEVFGASDRQVFWKIALPLALLGIVVAAVFSFVLLWNEFLMANLLTGGTAKTVSVGIWSGAGQNIGAFKSVDWDATNTLGTLAFVPVLTIILAIKRYLAKGFSLAMAR